jgi:haloalkane dehalogenase
MKDSAFRPTQLARWNEVVPDTEIVTLPNAGHWPHEEEPDAVIDAMRRFLHRTAAPLSMAR